MLDYRDEAELRAAVERLGSVNAVCREYELNRSTVQKWAKAYRIDAGHHQANTSIDKSVVPPVPRNAKTAKGEERPGATVTADGATVILPKTTTPPNLELRDPDQVLQDHRLDPAKWQVTNYTDNEWDGPSADGPTRFYQSKVLAKPRLSYDDLRIVLPSGWTPPKPRPRRHTTKPLLIPFFSDPHFPKHEEDLYEASLAWLDEHNDRIKEVIIPGDEGDWTPFGRHRKNRRTHITVSEAINGVYNGLAGWRNAAPNAPIKLLPGNHTHWLQARLADEYPDAVGIRRPGDDHDLLSLRSVVKLDELHIEYLDSDGEYHDVVYEVVDGLIVMHGTRTGPNGGALKEIRVWEGASVFQGHDHSGNLAVINYRLPDGGYVQRYALSMLAMCLRDLGYSSAHDVAQGFPVISVHEDGQWHPDIAFFNPQTRTTTWRDWAYKP